MCDLGIARHLVVTRRHLTGLDLVVDLDLIVDLDLVVDLAATAATLKCRAHPRIARLLYRRASLVTLAKVPAVVPEVGIVLTPPLVPLVPLRRVLILPLVPLPLPLRLPLRLLLRRLLDRRCRRRTSGQHGQRRRRTLNRPQLRAEPRAAQTREHAGRGRGVEAPREARRRRDAA